MQDTPRSEDAETRNLTAAVLTLLPALEQFLLSQERDPEQIASHRATWSAQLREPLPQSGEGTQAVLEILRDVVIPNGLRSGTPGFSGWVNTMPTALPIAASLAATVAGSSYACIQAFNVLEALALEWLAQLLGLPPTYQGIFTSGGSVANLIGLGAARQHAGERLGVDVAREGIAALPRPRLYASCEVHHVVLRAAAVLGLGRDAVMLLPTDDALRLDVTALQRQIRRDRAAGCTPIAIVATAGTTSSGAIDPLPEIATIAREAGIWLHVDGAYGLLGILDERVAPLYGNLMLADSLVIDPHKWLAAPVGCGATFVRDGALLERTFTLEPAAYIEQAHPFEEAGRLYTEEIPLACQFGNFGYLYHNFGIEQTAPSRGVYVWAILKEIGVEGVRARIKRHNDYARHLAKRVQTSACLELLAPVTLSVCCFRYVPACLRGREDHEATEQLNRLNREILDLVLSRGRCQPSSTQIRGRFAIRPCYINARTRLCDVDALADEVEACGTHLWAQHQAG